MPEEKTGLRFRLPHRPPKGSVIELIQRYATPGMHSVDVGANVGEFSEVLATYGPVTCIEPDPRCWDVLRRRVPSARVLETAVSAYAGVGMLHQAQEASQSSLYTTACPDQKTSCEVPVARLDDLVETADLVKIDAQGAEVAILRGASRLLHTCPVWILECWPHGIQAAGDDPLDLVRLCEAAGLSVKWADDTPCTVESLAAWMALDDQKFARHVNVVAGR